MKKANYPSGSVAHDVMRKFGVSAPAVKSAPDMPKARVPTAGTSMSPAQPTKRMLPPALKAHQFKKRSM